MDVVNEIFDLIKNQDFVFTEHYEKRLKQRNIGGDVVLMKLKNKSLAGIACVLDSARDKYKLFLSHNPKDIVLVVSKGEVVKFLTVYNSAIQRNYEIS